MLDLSSIRKRWAFFSESVLHAFTNKPEAADSLNQLALAAYNEGDHDFTIRCLKRAAELAENKEPIYIALGTVYYESAQYANAYNAFRQVLWTDYANLDALRGVAMSCHVLGSYDEAAYFYIEALSQTPDDYELRGNLGLAYHALGRVEDAVEELRTAVRLGEEQGRDDAYLHASLGKALYDSALFKDAEVSLSHAVELNPSDPDAVRFLGFVQQALDKTADAVASYNRALEFNPYDSDVHLRLSEALIDDDPARALAHAERAQELYHDNGSQIEEAYSYWAIGWAQYELGEWRLSAEASRAALELDSTLAEVRFNLGLALLRCDKLDEARAAYEEAFARPLDVFDIDNGIDDLQVLIDEQAKESAAAREILASLVAKRDELIARTESQLASQIAEERPASA